MDDFCAKKKPNFVSLFHFRLSYLFLFSAISLAGDFSRFSSLVVRSALVFEARIPRKKNRKNMILNALWQMKRERKKNESDGRNIESVPVYFNGV